MASPTKELSEELDRERSKILIERYDITVRELVTMATTKVDEKSYELNITPAYQRKFRWDQEDESKLVESVYLELPVPPLFMAANDDGTWEVIDGLQRISTLVHFTCDDEDDLRVVNKSEPLVLNNLEKLGRFEGSSFHDLPTQFRLRFEKKRMTAVVLQNTSDEDVRYDLFERLNKQGITLTPQEVRSCVHIDLMREISNISKNEDYQDIVSLAENNQNDGTIEEIVLKFIAYKNNLEDYDNSVKEFLNNFVENKGDQIDIEHEKEIFEEAVHQLNQVIDGVISRGNGNTTPVNLAEGILVAAGKLIEENNSASFEPKEGWMDDNILYENSTNGTNAESKLKGRIERSMELLKGEEVE